MAQLGPMLLVGFIAMAFLAEAFEIRLTPTPAPIPDDELPSGNAVAMMNHVKPAFAVVTEPKTGSKLVSHEPKTGPTLVSPEPKRRSERVLQELRDRVSTVITEPKMSHRRSLVSKASREPSAIRVSFSNPRQDATGQTATLMAAPDCSSTNQTVHVPYGKNVSFSSPNHPGRYPADTRCGWHFTTDKGYVLDLYCSSIQLKRGDFLDVFDKDFLISGFLERVNIKHFHYYFWGQDAFVGFSSNARGQGRGFQCYIWPVDINRVTTTGSTTAITAATATTAAAAATTTAPPNTADCVCGKDSSAGRIVGGQNADQFEYPWMVSLGTGGGQFCGASLISDEWIVTAAHCVDPGDSITVGLGYHNKHNSGEFTLKRRVREIIVHPSYDSTSDDSDIALLRIDKLDWTSNQFVRPICLPEVTSEQYVGQIGTITGWGTTSYEGSMSSILKEVDIPILANSECENAYDLTDNMVCAAVPEGGLDSCQGDSGGPMIVKDDGVAELVGVVSFGYECATPGYPGVYARVTEFVSWIKTKVETSGFCPRPGSTGSVSTAAPTAPSTAPPTAVSTVPPPAASVCVCGKKSSAGRIVGGQNADQFEYPWMVSLGVGGGQFCGASLISDEWIVTAAHCVDPGDTFRVGLGYHDKYNSGEFTLKTRVREVIVHPSYDPAETGNDGDIALLRIDKLYWTSNPFVRPICLPDVTSEQYVGQIATITGWGTTSYEGSMSDILQEVDIPILANSVCSDSYFITSNMVCAAVPQGGLDSCQGDSGGPMIVQGTSNAELVGVVSFGYKCAEKDYPGVYTRVTEYVEWINGEINSSGVCPRS